MASAKSASPKASAEQPGLGKGSAVQPDSQKSLSLSELNKASAKTGGEWLVHAFRPVEDIYQYTWQGKSRQGTNLIVTLVSAEDASQYCEAAFKKNSKNEVPSLLVACSLLVVVCGDQVVESTGGRGLR